MISWLKRHFIPHKGNDYRPHFLHRKNAVQLVGIILLFELIVFILPTLNFSKYAERLNLSSVLPAVLSTLTNEERESNNLPNLQVNLVLARVAQLKAEDMAGKSYFAHTSPEGKTPWYWFDQVGYKYQYAGENLAVNFSDSEEVTQAWMNSESHRANIVGRNYTEMGTGIAIGVYKGRETVFVAQVYGRPVVITPSETQTNPSFVGAPVERVKKSDLSVSPLPQVLGESTPTPKSPNYLQKTLSNPRQTANAVFFTILSIVFIALFLNVIIKLKHHFPDLIKNGVIVALIIISLHFANSYIVRHNFETTFIEFTPPTNEISLR